LFRPYSLWYRSTFYRERLRVLFALLRADVLPEERDPVELARAEPRVRPAVTEPPRVVVRLWRALLARFTPPALDPLERDDDAALLVLARPELELRPRAEVDFFVVAERPPAWFLPALRERDRDEPPFELASPRDAPRWPLWLRDEAERDEPERDDLPLEV
jgi:hypothetical protein